MSCTSTAISITHHLIPGSEIVFLLIIWCCFLVARSNLYHIWCTLYFLGMFASPTSFRFFFNQLPSECLDLTWTELDVTFSSPDKKTIYRTCLTSWAQWVASGTFTASNWGQITFVFLCQRIQFVWTKKTQVHVLTFQCAALCSNVRFTSAAQ